MEPDAAGAMTLEGGQRLQLWQRSPSAFDGVDVSVVAPRDAKLIVRLSATDEPDDVRREIPLADLVGAFQNISLDDRNNRLLVRRAPGDQIRLRLERDSLVFSPGERLELEAIPHLTGFAPHTPVFGSARLVPADGGDVLWSQTQELTVAADGAIPSTGRLSIPAPREEGVYNVILRLESKAPADSPRAAPTVVERRVQFVVIDPQPRRATVQPNEDVTWRSVLELDPANPKWWERMTRWPQLTKWLPGYEERELASSTLQTERRGDRRFVALEPGGWRAFPLPLGLAPGPHVLEVTYPTDGEQALVISIVEPNSAGEVSPLGVDSGVVVAPPDLTSVGEAPGSVGVHRLIFWPRTEAPVVLLTNPRNDKTTLVGRIRVLRGPERLPPAADLGPLTAPTSFPAISGESQPPVYVDDAPVAEGPRMLAAWFDKPLFPENFSAPEGLDEGTRRSLDDWRTFYVGAVRMIEYLKSCGYNAVSIAVWCEGSTLYPSRLLEPTPKYDTGTLFVSGQDPVRKDVLEMLLRLCAREGVRLIPALHFSTPLPEVEKLLRSEVVQRDGLEWVNWRGRTWLQERGAPRGTAPYYNPLDERVQTAMTAVVQELVDRYGKHRSFGGVALHLGPNSYAILPGQFWGYDDRTVRQFSSDTGVQVPGEGERRFEQRDQWFKTEGRDAWLAWRAQRLASLYRKMGKAVSIAGPQAKLYLAGVDLTLCEPVEWMMRPGLPRRHRFDEAMLHVGLDPKLWQDQPNIVLPRPRRLTPLATLPEQAVSVELNASPGVTEFFAAAGTPAGLFYHTTRPLRLEAFDKVSPFGRDKTYTWLAPHLSTHGGENRRRLAHLLARSDVRTIFEGGWMLPLGQEQNLQPLLDVYRRLPDVPFDDVTPTMGLSAQPVVVRQKSYAGKSWVYLVNDSPWFATVELELDAPPDCTVEPLSDRVTSPLEPRGGRVWWKVELAPYDIVGAVFSSPETKVVDYLATLPSLTVEDVRRRVRDVGARAYQLREPQEYGPLVNAGFEEYTPQGGPVGWESGGAWGGVTRDVALPYEGRYSLRLQSPGDDAPTWLRSGVIKPPRTGKLTMSVWVRVADAARQPELRLSAQWVRDGVPDYRPAFFGRGSPFPLTTEWREYVFPIPLPPAEISQLRVGIDVYGPGEVWIDNVRLYDARFETREKEELKKIYGGAEHDLSQGQIADCLRFLEGYWPQFLYQFVEPPPVRAAEAAPPLPAPTQEQPSMLDRLRRWSPTRLLPF